LINDVLDLSRIEAGRIDVQPEVFDLHEMLLGLGEMFSLRADRKGLTVVFDLAPDVPQYIRADAGKLRQVLINLLGNAVKFTERGGVTMTLEMCAPASSSQGASAERAGAAGDLSLHFEVQDTGVGIASDELDQLFDAFVQTESGRRSRQGTGLGLPISRQYVRMMGGDLTVRSEVGKGSCFAFDLGFATPTPDDVAALERGGFHRKIRVDITPDQVTPEGEVYRILVVDDVASSRWLLEKLLTPLGFAVRTAIDGQQGLALWEAWRPHLIFMDMRMPVMDGRTTTRLIKVRSRKAVSAEPEPVVVALTSSAFEADRADILAAGCDDFIPKPFRDVMIYEVLERHLGVQFNYVDSPEGGGLSRDARSLSQRELVAGLAAQPEALRKHLAAAALNGDIERLEQLIDKIGERNMALAETLDALAYDFAYDEIIRLVEEVDGV
jgi:CheY-like chemotaxis protein